MKRSASRRGFTMVELIVTLVILGILAAMAVPGLAGYTRLAAFNQNEATAKTLYLAAQTALTGKDASGELTDFLGTGTIASERSVKNADGGQGGYFTGAIGNTSADELNTRIRAIFLDKGEYRGSHSPDGQLVLDLLDDYVYDKALLDAAICVELDLASGQVYAVFYSTKSDSLSFRGGAAEREGGTTNLSDRGYNARRGKTLVGYYSARDTVNRVNLAQIRLRLNQKQLVNSETLSLIWRSNSRHESTDVTYNAAFYKADDADAQRPLFVVTVDLHSLQTGCGYKSGSVLAELPVTVYRYSGDTQTGGSRGSYWFPLTYTDGTFTLTLDAMLDAQLLYDCTEGTEADALQKSSFYSVTRFIADPENIYAVITAAPNENRDPGITEEYTPSAAEEGKTNTANTLFADGSAPETGDATAYAAGIAQYRHLYNVRFMQGRGGKFTYAKATYTFIGTLLDWLGSSNAAANDRSAVTVFRPVAGTTGTAATADKLPAARHPDPLVPVAWPTLPTLSQNQTIDGGATSTVLSNLQLRSDSVATKVPAGSPADAAPYLGLVGANYGAIEHLTLQDTDLVVNLTDSTDPDAVTAAVTRAAEEGAAALAGAPLTLPLLRGVGALCGLSTGRVTDVKLVKTAGAAAARVAAAVAVDGGLYPDAADRQKTAAGPSQSTDTIGDIRGIGGVVGIARAAAAGESSDEYRVSEIITGLPVIGILQETVNTGAAAPDDATRYTWAAQTKADGGLYLPAGIGGVAGYAQYGLNRGADRGSFTALCNTAEVTGNMLTGGLAGCMTNEGEAPRRASQICLKNTGLVRASAGYDAAASRYAGQFFGGIAGYARDVALWNAKSTAGKAQNDSLASFTKTALQPLCKGDFVGGLVGYANHVALNDGSATGAGGLVTGSRFVGGFAGGSNAGVLGTENSTPLTNQSFVFGNRFVGGVTGANGAGGTVRGFLNAGVVAGLPLPAADGSSLAPLYIGGIVGRNDGGWGTGAGTATIDNCGSTVCDENGSIVKALAALGADTADFVGGIAGYNENALVDSGDAALSVVLVGHSCVGGVVGKNTGTVTGAGAVVAGVVTGATRVGGLVGQNDGHIAGGGNVGGEWLAATSDAAVTATGSYAGGVVGYQAENGLAQAAAGAGSVIAQGGFAGCVAGYNAKTATLQNCRAGGAATADHGYAAGVAAQNDGTIDACGDYGGEDDAGQATFVLQGFTAAGSADAIGAAAAVNNGTIQNTRLGDGVNLQGGSAGMLVGGLAGKNAGTIKNSRVVNWLRTAPGSIAALGGAVGRNETTGTVDTVAVAANLGGDYPAVGGVAGINLGIIAGSAYGGTLSGGVGSAGWCLGGIAGQNGDDTATAAITNCRVDKITIAATGAFNLDAALDAAAKLERASHVGGIVGRNRANATVGGCLLATEAGRDNRIAARYGFVGGIAGSNNGTVENCGGQGTAALVEQVNRWITTTAGTNEMVAALTNDTGSYAGLRGRDEINNGRGASQNELRVELTGHGYLAGVAAFNAQNGVVKNSASGRWFIYSNNAAADSVVGGVIGQNESDARIIGLVNCAAVRRYIASGNDNKLDGEEPDNNLTGEDNRQNQFANEDFVGGVFGEQQNRTATSWEIARCVNYGSVFNSRANCQGGVIARWRGSGGTLDHCFNFGELRCNANKGSGSGTAGGIVAFISEPANGASVQLLHCQNHGSLLGTQATGDNGKQVYFAAGDCGGIVGRVAVQSENDALTVNILDCVNGENAKIYAQAMADGIISYLGPSGSGSGPNNTTLTIDRCRNFSTVLHAYSSTVEMSRSNGKEAGIYGARSHGNAGLGMTHITNCFSLCDGDSQPLIANGGAVGGAYTMVDGSNNDYMDTYSVSDAYIAGLKTMTRRAAPLSDEAADDQRDLGGGANADPGQSADTDRIAGQRLYAGIDNAANAATDGENCYPYFAARLGSNVNAPDLHRSNSYIDAPGGFANRNALRSIYSTAAAPCAALPLLYGDADGSGGLSLHDVRDETIQNYDTYLLDADPPGTPQNVTVQRSSAAAESVCGRYQVSWQNPAGSNARYYLVKVYLVDETGSQTGDPLLTQTVYETGFAFAMQAAWGGKLFQVSVAAENAAEKSSDTATSAATVFDAALCPGRTVEEPQAIALPTRADTPAVPQGTPLDTPGLAGRTAKVPVSLDLYGDAAYSGQAAETITLPAVEMRTLEWPPVELAGEYALTLAHLPVEHGGRNGTPAPLALTIITDPATNAISKVEKTIGGAVYELPVQAQPGSGTLYYDLSMVPAGLAPDNAPQATPETAGGTTGELAAADAAELVSAPEVLTGTYVKAANPAVTYSYRARRVPMLLAQPIADEDGRLTYRLLLPDPAQVVGEGETVYAFTKSGTLLADNKAISAEEPEERLYRQSAQAEVLLQQ